jgi:hypothetical protein
MTHSLIKPAEKIANTLRPLSSGKLPQEVIVLDRQTVSIVVEVDGVDYILSMLRIPAQRPRPTTN